MKWMNALPAKCASIFDLVLNDWKLTNKKQQFYWNYTQNIILNMIKG